MYPEFLKAFQAHTLAFQKALLNFQELRAQGPFLFETLGNINVYKMVDLEKKLKFDVVNLSITC